MKLKEIAKHTNRDLRKCSIKAHLSFLKNLSQILIIHSEANKMIFEQFFQDFKTELKSEDGSSDVFMISLRGIGLFAPLIKHYNGLDTLNSIANLIVQKSVFCYSRDSSSAQQKGVDHDSKKPYISNLLYSLVAILDELEEDNLVILDTLQNLTTKMFIQFPALYYTARVAAAISIREMFLTLFKKGLLFHQMFRSFSYNALILTCSDHYQGTEIDREAVDHSYQDYWIFWESLFSTVASSDNEYINLMQIEDDVGDKFQSSIFDILMDSTILLITNLDFSTTENDVNGEVVVNVDFPLSGDVSTLTASNPKDFAIFVNLVAFFTKLLNSYSKHRIFYHWICPLSQFIVNMSVKYPLVSGFYKMMNIVILKATELDFFKGILDPEFALESRQGIELEINQDVEEDYRKSCYFMTVQYLNRSINLLRNFKDDLLFSCLQLVLKSPKDLIFITDLVFPLQLALESGLSHLPLALLAIEAMEYLISNYLLGEELFIFKSTIVRLLPLFKGYLTVNTQTAFEPIDGKILKSKSKKRSTKAPMDFENETITLRQCQSKIITFLGKVGSDSKYVLGLESDKLNLTTWDTTKHLKFVVPFKDINCPIFLGFLY